MSDAKRKEVRSVVVWQVKNKSIAHSHHKTWKHVALWRVKKTTLTHNHKTWKHRSRLASKRSWNFVLIWTSARPQQRNRKVICQSMERIRRSRVMDAVKNPWWDLDGNVFIVRITIFAELVTTRSWMESFLTTIEDKHFLSDSSIMSSMCTRKKVRSSRWWKVRMTRRNRWLWRKKSSRMRSVLCARAEENTKSVAVVRKRVHNFFFNIN